MSPYPSTKWSKPIMPLASIWAMCFAWSSISSKSKKYSLKAWLNSGVNLLSSMVTFTVCVTVTSNSFSMRSLPSLAVLWRSSWQWPGSYLRPVGAQRRG
ncbi:hypothetical protein [Vibrio phage VP882]|uniref:Uncharacterized protein n=1 Tax=Vibrio phage VP882 TaxID=2913982 RepID=A2I2Z4_9CAUD|nr:hypothetical protein VPVV882_gp44 [Vibrio phage VP882]ABM73408.1 hypothetical protein [Vibrio phage VP882]